MYIQRSPLTRGGLPAIGALAFLAGCQQYQPVPLDLSAHRDAVDARITSFESLGQSSSGVPDRFSLDDGLSPAEGEALALFYNADLRLLRLEAGVARADADHAGLWQDPTLGFDAAEVLASGGGFEHATVLGLTIPVSGRLGAEREAAEARHDAALIRVVDAEWATRAEVRSAWARWSAAADRLDLLGTIGDRVGGLVDLADRLEEAGELTAAEARLIRAERVTNRARLAAATRSEAIQRIELLGLLGLAPDAAVTLNRGYPTPPIPDGNASELLIRRNLELAARRAEYRSAEHALRAQIRAQFPDITLGGGYGYEDDDRLILGVSIPIPILNANRGGIAHARAERDVARAAAETSFERISRDHAAALATLGAVGAQRRAFESELIPMLEAQTQEIDRLAGLGEIDTLLLLETVTRAGEAADELLDLRVAEVEAINAIVRLLGPQLGPDAVTPQQNTDDPAAGEEDDR